MIVTFRAVSMTRSKAANSIIESHGILPQHRDIYCRHVAPVTTRCLRLNVCTLEDMCTVLVAKMPNVTVFQGNPLSHEMVNPETSLVATYETTVRTPYAVVLGDGPALIH